MDFTWIQERKILLRTEYDRRLQCYVTVQTGLFFVWAAMEILKRRCWARLQQCVGFSPTKTIPTSSPISPQDHLEQLLRVEGSGLHYHDQRFPRTIEFM